MSEGKQTPISRFLPLGKYQTSCKRRTKSTNMGEKVTKTPPESRVSRARVHTHTVMDLIPGQPSSEEGLNLLNHAVCPPIKMHMKLQMQNNPVTECFMGTLRESIGFHLPHLKGQHIKLLTCLVFSSFRLKTSLLSMYVRFWVSLRIV